MVALSVATWLLTYLVHVNGFGDVPYEPYEARNMHWQLFELRFLGPSQISQLKSQPNISSFTVYI